MRPFVICVVVLAIMSATVPAAHGGVEAAPRCVPANTVVWLALSADSGAGSTFVTLEMTNLSRHVCTLYGFPGVSAVDLAVRQVGAAAARDRATPAREVRLSPGQTAGAQLRIAHVSNFPTSACRPVQAAGFRVYLPGATRSKLVPFPVRACSKTGPVFLNVRVVAAAS
jgi:hypothetical protein